MIRGHWSGKIICEIDGKNIPFSALNERARDHIIFAMRLGYEEGNLTEDELVYGKGESVRVNC